MENSIKKLWAVESIELLNSGEKIQLGMNLMDFEGNHTCTLPALIGEKRSLGDWKIKSQEEYNILLISNCATHIFNDTFTINYEQLDDLNRMTLTSSKLKIVSHSARF